MSAIESIHEFSYASPEDARWRRAVIHRIEQATGKPRLWALYEDYCRGPAVDDFFAEAVARLDLSVRAGGEGLDAIPRTGPVVVVANHPFGVVDGIVLGYLISRVRRDFKILVNSVLYRLPELRPHLLPIDFAETRAALKTNLKSRRVALKDLAEGRVIGIFPGGTVSTARPPNGQATDPEWKPFVSRLIQEGRADVVPVFFDGQNSRLFQWASRVSMTLRLSLLFREVVNKIGSDVDVQVGPCIAFDRLAGFPDRRQLAEYLRSRTYATQVDLPGESGVAATPPETCAGRS